MLEFSAETYWCQSTSALYELLGSTPSGLSSEDAARRLVRFGPNSVSDTPRRRILWRIARKFAEPLVAILLVAAAISAVTGDIASFGIIVLVIALSITLDVVQEHRAELAAEALKRCVAICADTWRDGKAVSLSFDRVVPGDVVELRAGSLVPADGVVIRSRDVHVNESLMTGEPFPAEKRAGLCSATLPADAFNALFAGTSVVSGEATMLVIKTGAATRLGGIAAALTSADAPSAFEHSIHRLGLLILRLTVFLVLLVLLTHLAFGRPMLESFLFAVALAVGLTPELLPMIMTVTLSRGALRMAAKSVIVKRLTAIHDLGAMDVLCTDKTGTLTEANISLVGHPGAKGIDAERTLTLALVNSCFSTGIRSPLDEAVVNGCSDQRIRQWVKRDEIPFDFERRCVTVLAESPIERLLIVKGAPERILSLSTMADTGNGECQPLDDPWRARLLHMQEEQAALGRRLLAVAWKQIPKEQSKLDLSDERNLTFAGYCIFVDPPKRSAASAVARLAAAGVRVKVVSGDHEAVVRHVVDELKIPARGLLTGTELIGLTDSALAARIEQTDMFARVTPDQKTRIICALQARGHTVGFLGDGVNDAPAIRAAEIGLSVEGATDVARGAADMILLTPDLGVLADGVREGRRTFTNILKYVRMGTSSNFSNMLSMAIASLVLPFLPLLPVQILLNNLLYDLSEIGIPFDSVDKRDLARPRAWDMKILLRFTLVMGIISSAFDLLMFAMLSQVFHVTPNEFRTAWFIESTATQILVIFIIRTNHYAWNGQISLMLVGSSIGALILVFTIIWTPVGHAFGFTTLPMGVLAASMVIVIFYLIAAELAKPFAFGERENAPSTPNSKIEAEQFHAGP